VRATGAALVRAARLEVAAGLGAAAPVCVARLTAAADSEATTTSPTNTLIFTVPLDFPSRKGLSKRLDSVQPYQRTYHRALTSDRAGTWSRSMATHSDL